MHRYRITEGQHRKKKTARNAGAGSPPDKPKQQRRSLAPDFEIAGENFREFELEGRTQFCLAF
jgi:hypothetical protein